MPLIYEKPNNTVLIILRPYIYPFHIYIYIFYYRLILDKIEKEIKKQTVNLINAFNPLHAGEDHVNIIGHGTHNRISCVCNCR